MSILAKTVDSARIAEIEYPEIDGFKLKIAYVSSEDMGKMLERNSKIVFSKLTRQKEKEVDNESFLKEYSEKVIQGWSGLKFKHLHYFYPCDLTGFNPEDEVPYDKDDALLLLKESTDFNAFLTTVTNDVTQFNKEAQEQQVKN